MSGEVAGAPPGVVTGAARDLPGGARQRAGRRRLAWQPYAMIAPATVFMAVFFLWPAVQALVIAFQTASGTFTTANFQTMLKDTDFGLSLRDTLLLLAFIIPIETAIALAMALLASTRLRGTGVMLYIWSLPLAMSDLAAGLVWLAVFTSHGYLNSALQDLHLIRHPVGFLNYDSPITLVAAIVIAEVWRSISVVMVIVMSGLQAIPAELGEAAELMGAGPWRRLTRVTLPLLRPSLQVALILRTTAALQVFAVVLALGGSALPVLAIKTEQWVYDYENYQLAAAYAVFILGLSALSTITWLVVLRTPRQVYQR